ncbi:MAG: hypothetical protein IJD02_04320 [Lachnospiraceae bacterium]|nr:hypothetical protein [Lachnospiraceae bacterium]
MKKFGKFLFGVVSAAAVVGGAVYFLKNIVSKDEDGLDDFDDDFEDDLLDDFDDDFDVAEDVAEDREYVTLNLDAEVKEAESEQAFDAESEN